MECTFSCRNYAIINVYSFTINYPLRSTHAQPGGAYRVGFIVSAAACVVLCWAIPQYLGHLHHENLYFWQKSLRTIHTYHLVPFKLPKNVQGGPFQGLLVFYN